MWLTIDTTTRRNVIGLYDDESSTVIVEKIFEPRQTQKIIFDQLAAILDPDTMDQLDLVIVGTGPGSFTGVKIGVMAAKALTWSRSIPLIGVSSLHSVASGIPIMGDGTQCLIVAVPSTRGEVYIQKFRQIDNSWVPDGPVNDLPLKSSNIQTLLPKTDYIISGEAAAEIADITRPSGVAMPEDQRYPIVTGLVNLARQNAISGNFDDPMTLNPNYFRESQPERLESGGAV